MQPTEYRLWVEKYRPTQIDDAKSLHADEYDMLGKLA